MEFIIGIVFLKSIILDFEKFKEQFEKNCDENKLIREKEKGILKLN